MATIDAKRFGEICDGVWFERAEVLRKRGRLSGEATLMRAVFWRLCKAGVKTNARIEDDLSEPEFLAYQLIVVRMLQTNARPAFNGAPILEELIERYRDEVINNL